MGSFQCSSSLLVIPVTPGYPASRQASTRGLIWLTRGISTNMPGSSKDLELPEAIT
ncbi:MAG: hypothetical protein U9N48_03870 [Euryarchaeota archaeon]|nr:hypothetical protein [Euryarchaeota archaeon]